MNVQFMGNTILCSRKCIKYGYAIFDQHSLDHNLIRQLTPLLVFWDSTSMQGDDDIPDFT